MSAANGRYDPQPKNLREVFDMIDASKQQRFSRASVHAGTDSNRATSHGTTGEAQDPICTSVDVTAHHSTGDKVDQTKDQSTNSGYGDTESIQKVDH